MESTNELRLGANEMKFAEIIWENAPLSSMRLAELARERLGWAKTTSYTVLRRLCEKGILSGEKDPALAFELFLTNYSA